MALLVDLAELMLLGNRDQIALIRIGPGMEGTGEARALPLRIILEDGSAVSAGIEEGVKGPRVIAGREYRDPKVRQGDEAAWLGQIGTEPDDLGVIAKELAPLLLRHLRRDIDVGWISQHATRIDVGVLVEMGHEFFK